MDGQKAGTTRRDVGINAARKFFTESVSKPMRTSVREIMTGVTDDQEAFELYEAYASALLTLLIGDFTVALGPVAIQEVLRRSTAAGVVGGTVGHLELRSREAADQAAAAVAAASVKH